MIIKDMKQYVYLIFFFSFFAKSVAQDMSIEFSTEWEEKLDFQFKEFEKENIRPAYLNITYRNISNKPLYCLKITEGKVGLPEILWFHNAMSPASRSLLDVGDDYFKRKYFVGFKSNPYYNMNLTWDIRNDTTDIEYKIIKEIWNRPVYDILIKDGSTRKIINPIGVIGGDSTTLNDWITTTLDDIYNCIYYRYYSDEKEKIEQNSIKQMGHYSSNITQDTILNKSIDKFVFLKPGETYVDKFNLIGFQKTVIRIYP